MLWVKGFTVLDSGRKKTNIGAFGFRIQFLRARVYG